MGAPFGILLLFNLDPELVRRAMGIVVFLIAVVMLAGYSYKGPRGIAPRAIVGGFSGALGGAVGMGGPPLVLYFLAGPEDAKVQRANIVVTVAIMVAIVLCLLIVAGGISLITLQRAVLLLPAYLIGTWSGSKLFAIAPAEYFKRVALWVLVATGIGVLVL